MNEAKIKEIIETLVDTFLEAGQISLDLRKKGLLVVPASNNVVRLLPPLNINKKEAKKAISIISEVVSEFK